MWSYHMSGAQFALKYTWLIRRVFCDIRWSDFPNFVRSVALSLLCLVCWKVQCMLDNHPTSLHSQEPQSSLSRRSHLLTFRFCWNRSLGAALKPHHCSVPREKLFPMSQTVPYSLFHITLLTQLVKCSTLIFRKLPHNETVIKLKRFNFDLHVYQLRSERHIFRVAQLWNLKYLASGAARN